MFYREEQDGCCGYNAAFRFTGSANFVFCKSLRCRWFTLLELLVVISVIVVLASLLLPSLQNAKKMAKTIKCTNNLRQLGIVSLSYMGDWNNLPNYWDGSSSWYKVLGSLNYIRWDVGGTVHSDAVWMYCPSYIPSGMLDAEGVPVYSTTYGINASKTSKLSVIQTPSEYPIYADTICDTAGNLLQTYHFWCNVQPQKVHLRHRKKANFWFLDGHVGAFSQDEISQWTVFPNLYQNTYSIESPRY